jgi:hypothetical protein
LSWRWASAAMVSNTSEDLPEPDTPTNAVTFRFGTRTATFRRLFSRAPVTEMNSCLPVNSCGTEVLPGIGLFGQAVGWTQT